MKNIILKSTIFSIIMLFFLASFMYFKLTELPKRNFIIFEEPFHLISHNGKKITEKIFQAKPSILFFGFTNCPEVCPTTLYDIASWISELSLSSEQIQVLFVTLDPKRDTETKLKDYLSNFDETFLGITGDEKEILNLSKALSIYRKIILTDNVDYSIDHTSTIFLINNDKTLKGTIAFRESSEAAIKKVKNLIEKNL
mgnify:CR=1 FL=1